MNNVPPERAVRYFGPMFDSARWDGFNGRDDDIFICTHAKAGTTWAQTICAALLFGWRGFDVKPSDVSQWYEATRLPLETMNKWLDEQSHRRFIKTHTPLDGIPYRPSCTYVTVFRDPRDVFFSLRSHADNMRTDALRDTMISDTGEAFRSWVETAAAASGQITYSLETIVNHYLSYQRFSHLDNIHVFHYADMKRNLPGAVAGFANALGVAVNEEDIEQISRIADFDNMRGNPDQFTPNADAGRWKDSKNFFSKGRSGQWREVIGDADLALYDQRIATLLPSEQIAWLHDGAGQ